MTTIGHAARELGEHLIGMSVLEPEAAWDQLARRGDWVGPGGLLHCALAPLDIAVLGRRRQDARVSRCIGSSAAIAIGSRRTRATACGSVCPRSELAASAKRSTSPTDSAR